MAIRIVEQGIQAVQNGNRDEARRLLRYALKEDLSPSLRATTLMWLAETGDDINFKVDCYRQAADADPQNNDVQQRLSYWLSQQLPSAQPPQGTPPQAMPPQGMPQAAPPPQQNNAISYPTQGYNVAPPSSMPPGTLPTAPNASQQVGMGQNQGPMQIQGQQRVVGVLGGPLGDGSGFFVTREGLVATTRAVTGSQPRVSVDLLSGHRLVGEVVRSFPQYDVSLVKVNAHVEHLATVSPSPYLQPDAPIVVTMHGGKGLRSQRRNTRSAINDNLWFPTVIHRNELDAGGAPVYDEHNLLVGMITRNTSRTNDYAYGLHISQVYRCVEQYAQESHQVQGQKTTTCTNCGAISRAPQYGAFYCETCGSTLPYAENITRYPLPNAAALYQENMHRPCPNCQAQVGYYDSRCLRCGFDFTTQRQQ